MSTPVEYADAEFIDGPYKGWVTYDKRSRTWVFDCEPHIMIMVRKVFPKTSSLGPGVFTADRAGLSNAPDAARDVIMIVERYSLPLLNADRDRLYHAAEAQDRALRATIEILGGRAPSPAVQLLKTLYDYQQVPVQLALEHNRLLIADGLGLGKTPEGIAIGALEGGDPVLVACPTHLCLQWKQEIIDWFPNARVQILTGHIPYDTPRDTTHYITTYRRLAKWALVLQRVKRVRTILFDECQALIHPDTDQYRAAFHLSESALRVIGLSGTPIHNYGVEIYDVVNVIRPGFFGARAEFVKEWCVDKLVRDPILLGEHMRRHGMIIRRTRKDVGRELPPARKHILPIDADLASLRAMDNVLSALAQRALSGSFEESGAAARKFDMLLREATGIAKAKAVAEIVKTLLESQKKVLLAGWHRAVYNIWLEELKDYKPVMYTGSESPKQKEEARSAFVFGDARVLIISLRSGAGINGLETVCSTLVNGELDWTQAIHDQLSGRLERGSQDEVVNIYFPVVNDGSDPVVMHVLGLKKAQREGIVDLAGNDTVLAGAAETGRLIRSAEEYLQRNALGFFRQAGAGSRLLKELVLAVEQVNVAAREMDLHDQLEPLFQEVARRHGVECRREFALSPESRIDFLVGTVGIECKVKGQRTDVYRQLERYCKEDQVTEMIAVTPWPLQDLNLQGKLVRSVSPAHGGL